MNKLFCKGLISALICFSTFVVVYAQDKKVNVELEVDGKPVKSKFTVTLKSFDVSYELRTEKEAFFLPQNLKLDEWVDVVIRFKKHVLEFDRMHYSNFNTDWTVGVDLPPYSAERLGYTDPKDVSSLYYMEFGGHPGRILTVMIKRHKEK